MGSFMIVPLIVGAFSGFALLGRRSISRSARWSGFSSALLRAAAVARAGIPVRARRSDAARLPRLRRHQRHRHCRASGPNRSRRRSACWWRCAASPGCCWARRARSSRSTSTCSTSSTTTLFGLPLFFLLAVGLTLIAGGDRHQDPRSAGMCRRSAATITAAARAGISVKKVRVAALLLVVLRRRPRRHRLCRPARLGRARHRLRPRVPGLCGADDRRLLDPARRRRQSDRRRAGSAGCGRRLQHSRSARPSAPTTSTSSSGCCCSPPSCSTACAAATPTNNPITSEGPCREDLGHHHQDVPHHRRPLRRRLRPPDAGYAS